MFDTILGLPLHPLVVHAVVVLGPLAAVLLILYAVVPALRACLRVPLLVLSAIAAVSGFVAQEAGEALEHLTHEPGFDHAAKGDRAFIALLVLFLATLVVIGLGRPRPAPPRTPIVAVIALLAAAFALYAVARAGHSGAKAVWSDTLSSAPAAAP